MDSLSVDAQGPFPEDIFGNRYILSIICNFSKYVHLFPTKSVTAKEYVDALLSHIGIFGIPSNIRSDQGTQFTADIITELNKIIQLDHLLIVPYHPQANGIVERRNREINKHLRAMVLEQHIIDNWSRYLPLINRILNTTYDRSIGTYPSKIIFGDMLKTALPYIIPIKDPTNVPTHQYLQDLKKAQLQLIEASQKYIQKQKENRESKYSQIYPESKYDLGEYVLVKHPNKPASKLNAVYRGPMVILDNPHPDIYTVADLITNKQYSMHVTRLVKFHVAATLTPDDIIALAASDVNEQVVQAILDHRGNPKKKSSLEFLIRWEGQDSTEDTWETYANIKDVQALDEYSRQHPELKLG
jgi:hypothetical protein